MKQWLTAAMVFIALSASAQNPVEWVNPLVGTDSQYELSNGNTYPAIGMPWGMHYWTPQTNKMGNGWCYQYDAMKIRGFKLTHQPSPWINDYGAFSIFPMTDKLEFDENKRESWFSHKAELAKPHYYQAYLASYHTNVEIAPTERSAVFRISYPKTNEAYLVVDGFFKNSFIKVSPDQRQLIGYACNAAGGVPSNFKNYFVMTFDQPIAEVIGVQDGVLERNLMECKSRHSGSILRFVSDGKTPLQVKISASFISWEQAWQNLQAEVGDLSFDQTVARGEKRWNSVLDRIRVEGGSLSDKQNFYTALYRVALFPRKLYEIDAKGDTVHYSPYNGSVLPGKMYTDNGFWDTFRAVFPLFSLVYPDVNAEIQEALVNTYQESGWLPEWASPGHRDCMVGSNSAIVIADSYLRGVANPNIEKAWEAAIKNTTQEGPLSSVGRLGAKYYNELGYIPYDVGINENAARTLEYALADFNLWQLGKRLGKGADTLETLKKRAMQYKNLFDPSTGFMRGKNKNGTFQSPFRPDKWGDAFTEGCSWHWTWCVMHDAAGLSTLMGGDEAFCKKLDSVFTAAPTFDYSYYGSQIHEITEMLVMNMGQYAHGNQPIQHMPYLYVHGGRPASTQYHVRNIMQKLYQPTPDGLCGDEDNGQTSAWFVFSALGFYPVTPGSGEYVIGSPLFDKALLNFGKTQLEIRAQHQGPSSWYVHQVKRNGKVHAKTFFHHTDLIKGGTIDFKMSEIPALPVPISRENRPYSMSTDPSFSKP
ncbi:MAG TPA: GH92 family glycosyl hydrolase [Luteibaculaceae bacterium]|nr:GH92 family glycosyl hydrolase [Luteibaculaceae bacterium]